MELLILIYPPPPSLRCVLMSMMRLLQLHPSASTTSTEAGSCTRAQDAPVSDAGPETRCSLLQLHILSVSPS